MNHVSYQIFNELSVCTRRMNDPWMDHLGQHASGKTNKKPCVFQSSDATSPNEKTAEVNYVLSIPGSGVVCTTALKRGCILDSQLLII